MAAGPKPVLSKSKGSSATAPGTPPVLPRVLSMTITPATGVAGPRLIVASGPADSVDLTQPLTAAVAHALWQLRGGQDIANWVDAERLVSNLLTSRAETTTPEVVIPRRRPAKT